MQKYAHVCRHISRAHFEFHMCALLLPSTIAIYHANQTCRSTLRIFGFYVWMRVWMCVHNMFGSRVFECVTHAYFCNGLKVELNNEIPVSTSLSFCMPSQILQVACAMHDETDSDVSLLIYYKYNILIFSCFIHPIFMQMG